MKKTIYYGFAVLLMLAVVGTAAAVDNTSDVATDVATAYGCQGQGSNYADLDGNSVCDNFVDANGDGINDDRPRNGEGNGLRDGTGCNNGGNCPRDGTGYGSGNGNGNGNGNGGQRNK